MDEFDRIARYFAPLAAPSAFALRDDAALLDARTVVTKDCMVAGVHFMGDEDASLIARKLLRVNLSDIAAMGARPTHYLVGLMAPALTPEAWFAAFARGLSEDQAQYGIMLLGGDTTATPGPLSLSLTMFGRLETAPLLRSGAKVGDAVYMSGTLGDAALGLRMLQGSLSPRGALIARYHLPQPRTDLALGGIAHACMDISDGLLQDMGHIARASGVGVELEASLLPLSADARALLAADASLLEPIVTGGDDYEILFTAPENLLLEGVTRIGRVVAGEGVHLRDADGNALHFARAGYTHF